MRPLVGRNRHGHRLLCFCRPTSRAHGEPPPCSFFTAPGLPSNVIKTDVALAPIGLHHRAPQHRYRQPSCSSLRMATSLWAMVGQAVATQCASRVSHRHTTTPHRRTWLAPAGFGRWPSLLCSANRGEEEGARRENREEGKGLDAKSLTHVNSAKQWLDCGLV